MISNWVVNATMKQMSAERRPSRAKKATHGDAAERRHPRGKATIRHPGGAGAGGGKKQLEQNAQPNPLPKRHTYRPQPYIPQKRGQDRARKKGTPRPKTAIPLARLRPHVMTVRHLKLEMRAAI